MLRLYMDESVDGPISDGLKARGVDAVTVQEDGRAGLEDPYVLDRAQELERVAVSQDEDFLSIATHRQREGIAFSGVIFAPKEKAPWGWYIDDLQMIAEAESLKEYQNRVQYLPFPRPSTH